MAAQSMKVTFSNGPLGIETEPVWRSGGRPVGCRVVSFLKSFNGDVGQAERTGLALLGATLEEVQSEDVREMSYDKILALLKLSSLEEAWECVFLPTTPPTSKGTLSDLSNLTDASGDAYLSSIPSQDPIPCPEVSPGSNTELVHSPRLLAPMGWAMSLLRIKNDDQEKAHLEVAKHSLDVVQPPSPIREEGCEDRSEIDLGGSNYNNSDAAAATEQPRLSTFDCHGHPHYLPPSPPQADLQSGIHHEPELSRDSKCLAFVTDESGVVTVVTPEICEKGAQGIGGDDSSGAGLEVGDRVEEDIKVTMVNGDLPNFADVMNGSLDTVSLISEAGLGRVGGHYGDTGPFAFPLGSRDSDERENMRPLAQFLGVKLKERTRRCEELEDLSNLRDGQVSMLQRQSNSLAVKVSTLIEELADQTALSEALQVDRQRLVEEVDELKHAFRIFDGEILPKLESKGIAGLMVESVDAEESAAIAMSKAGSRGAGHEGVGRGRSPGHANSDTEARALALGEMVENLITQRVAHVEEIVACREESRELQRRVRELESVATLAGTLPGVVEGEEEARVGQLVGLRRLLGERTQELEWESRSAERLAARAEDLEDEIGRLQVALKAREADIVACEKTAMEMEERFQHELCERDSAQDSLRVEVEELRALTKAGDNMGSGGNEHRLVSEKLSWIKERGRLMNELELLQRSASGGAEMATVAKETAAQQAGLVALQAAKIKRLENDVVVTSRKTELEGKVNSLQARLEETMITLETCSGRNSDGVKGRGGTARDESGSGVASEGGDDKLEHKQEGKTDCSVRGSSSTGLSGVVKKDEHLVGIDQGSLDGYIPSSPTRWAVNPDHSFVGALERDILIDDLRQEVGQLRQKLRERGQLREREQSTPSSRIGDVHGYTGSPADGGKVDGRRVGEGETYEEAEGLGCEEDKENIGGEDQGSGGVQHCAVGGERQGKNGDSCSLLQEEVNPIVGEVTAKSNFRGYMVQPGGESGDNAKGQSAEELFLEGLEKDMVISQLRDQVQQLQTRLAGVRKGEGADIAPLENLLGQLVELKDVVREGEKREQQFRDEVDMGLIRMENLKCGQDQTPATGTSAPPSSSASLTAPGNISSPLLLSQAPIGSETITRRDQRLLHELEEHQWELNSQRRRLAKLEGLLREAQAEAASHERKCHKLERDHEVAQAGEEAAVLEVSAGKRHVERLQAEVRTLRDDLKVLHSRLVREAEERSCSEAATERMRATVSAAEAEAIRVRTELASFVASTAGANTRLLTKDVEHKAGIEVTSRKEVEQEKIVLVKELEYLRCSLAVCRAELVSIQEATQEFVHPSFSKGISSDGVGKSSGGCALQGALAAVTEARRARSREGDCKTECETLRARASAAQEEVVGLCKRLEESGHLVQAAQAQVEKMQVEVASLKDGDHKWEGTIGVENSMGDELASVKAEAEAREQQHQSDLAAAEEALHQAHRGATAVWSTVSSALEEGKRKDSCNSRSDRGEDGVDYDAVVEGGDMWNPKSDPSLRVLWRLVEHLTLAYRSRGVKLQQAQQEARVKSICAREARRRETAAVAKAKAQSTVEARMSDCLSRLHCGMEEEQGREQGEWHWQQKGQVWGFSEGEGSDLGNVSGEGGGFAREKDEVQMSREQVEHLRRIKEEVDRLQGQNEILQQCLSGQGRGAVRGAVDVHIKGRGVWDKEGKDLSRKGQFVDSVYLRSRMRCEGKDGERSWDNSVRKGRLGSVCDVEYGGPLCIDAGSPHVLYPHDQPLREWLRNMDMPVASRAELVCSTH